MRINKEESIILDEFTTGDEINMPGVLSLLNEFDDSNQIYVMLGTTPLGFIDKNELVKVAEKIIEMWKEKAVSAEELEKENP